MCFSATASFTASFLLLVCGIAALYRAKKNQRLFAMIPLLFSVQQFIEGTIWQSLTSGTAVQLATYAYLSFVFIIWPNWVPLSISLMSKRISEKKLMALPMIAGILTSILAISYSFVSSPQAMIVDHHIKYTAHLPGWLWIPGTCLYLFATIAPFFIPKISNLWMMGVVLALSYIATLLFYHMAILSVWCFFAAILSVFVFIIIR
jgi:hypothetical protein